MKNKYIPHALRRLNQQNTIKMPKRETLQHDKELLAYYRETYLMLVDLIVDTTEKVLEHDIPMTERFQMQNISNQLFDLNEKVKEQLPQRVSELHETRVDFVTEMINLCTLVKPKDFDKVQGKMVEMVKKVNKLK